jgi:pimeloyl-ACP methyl ester carboxylesterase
MAGGAAGLVALGSAAQASIGGAPQIIAARRTAFVLVHGTWHGGWCWKWVAERLRAEGHRVIAPTMTGCGERRHLIGPEVNLSIHVEDVVNAIEFAGLDDFVLVGHSFAGLTITGVADRLRSAVRRIIFFDALIPTDTRNAGVTRDPETGEWPEWWQQRLASFEDGYKMRFWDHYDVQMLVPREDKANIALLERYLTWHPAGQWTEPLRLGNGGWEGLPRTCIQASAQAYRPSSEAMLGPGRGPGWDFRALPVARNGFMTHPQIVAEAFMALS